MNTQDEAYSELADAVVYYGARSHRTRFYYCEVDPIRRTRTILLKVHYDAESVYRLYEFKKNFFDVGPEKWRYMGLIVRDFENDIDYKQYYKEKTQEEIMELIFVDIL